MWCLNKLYHTRKDNSEELTSGNSSISGVAGWEGGVGMGEGPGESPNIGKSNFGRPSPSDSLSEACGVTSPSILLPAFRLFFILPSIRLQKVMLHNVCEKKGQGEWQNCSRKNNDKTHYHSLRLVTFISNFFPLLSMKWLVVNLHFFFLEKHTFYQ